MSDFDLILEMIGPFGRYQVLQWLLCSFAWIPAGSQNLLNVFLQATPDHWCHVPQSTNRNVSGTNDTVPPPSVLGKYQGQCEINSRDFMKGTLYDNNDTFSETLNSSFTCTTWDFDLSLYGNTAVSKWDLVCTKSSFPAIAQAVYMLGFLLGTLVFGYLSDRFGRKTTLVFSLIGCISFGVISAFMPEFWSHMLMRTMTGVCVSGTLLTAFVQGMENIGIDQRLKPAVALQISFALGYMLLAPIAYLCKDFVWTNFTLSVMPIGLLCFLGFLPESPRWLMAQGRYSEAAKVLKKAAKFNGKSSVDVDKLIEEYSDSNTKLNDDCILENTHFTMVDLLRTPNMRKKTLNMFFAWFVVSFVYYGLTMGVTELGGDPYLNLFISGLMECISVVATMFILDRIGRRICLAVSLASSGVACVICGIVPIEFSLVTTVMSMIGKFAVSSSFCIIYVFAAELFPTVVRTVGVGGGSMSARIGGLIAPFVAELRHYWRPLPTIIFGVFSLTAGGLSLLFPETLGQKLPETLEDGERFGNDLVCEQRLDLYNNGFEATSDEKETPHQKRSFLHPR